MAGDNFYVTLPSNTSNDQFTENSQSNYITMINPPIVLSGDWVVGLTEIHLPKKVQNITKNNNKFQVSFGDNGRFDILQTLLKDRPKSSLVVSGDVSVYTQDLPNITVFEGKDVLGIELDIKQEIEFTREKYMSSLQAALELLEGKMVRDKKFSNGIKLEYKQMLVENAVTFVYSIIFKDGWKMLYDADDIEDYHIELARIFGTLPWAFFQPKENSMVIKKFDNLNGERKEFTTKLKTHRIYFYNTNITKPGALTTSRVKRIKSIKAKKQTCVVQAGCYMTPEKLVAAVTQALPQQMNDYFDLSVSVGGHLKITSFNHKYYNITFPNMLVSTLGQILGVSAHDLEEVLPMKPVIYADGYPVVIEDPDEVQVANLVVDPEDLPEGFESANLVVDPEGFESVNGTLSGNALIVANQVRTRGQAVYDPSYSHMGHYISKYPIDVYACVYGFYVYCDIVESGYTGNAKANLLRVVPTNVDNISVFSYSDEPHFKPVSVNYITKIHIVIKTDIGEDVAFSTESKTLCKLHFKKK